MTKKNPTTEPTTSTTVKPDAEASVIAPNTIIPITLPWILVEPAYQVALRELSKQVRLEGFRKGKVPPKLAKSMIGEDKLIDATLRRILPAVYQDELIKSGKQPLVSPEFNPVDLTYGQDWKLEAHIAEKPQLSTKGYEKAVAEGKKEFAAHVAEEKAAKKDAKADVKNPQPPQTDEQKAAQEKEHLTQHIFKALIATLKPAIPELLIKAETRAELESLAKELQQFKLSIDDYVARRGMTFDQLSAELASTALARLQLEYILEAIGKELNLSATEAELEEYFLQIDDKKTQAEYRKNEEYKAYITKLIQRKKLIDQLIA
ncbi:MAG: hypothetical protein M3Q81_03050 [bacterium]|nr:hypothetical protein [bacterium]